MCCGWALWRRHPCREMASCLCCHTAGCFRSAAAPASCGRRTASPSPFRDHLLLSYSTSGKTPLGALGWQIAAQAGLKLGICQKGRFRGTRQLASSIPADAGHGDSGWCLRPALLASSAPSPESLVGPAEPTLRNVGSSEVLQDSFPLHPGGLLAFCLVQSLPWGAEWLMCSPLLLQGGHLASASRPCVGAAVLSFWRDTWDVSALVKPCLQHPAVGARCPSSGEAPIFWRSTLQWALDAHPLEKHPALGTSAHPH